MKQFKVEVAVAKTDSGFAIEQVRCNGKAVAKLANETMPETYRIIGNDEVETFVGCYEQVPGFQMPWPVKELVQDHTFEIEVQVLDDGDQTMDDYHEVTKVIIDGQETERQLGVGYDDTSYWPLVVSQTEALVLAHYILG